MRLKGKKIVLLAENNYEDLELWATKDDPIHAGADYVDEEVVRDGNLITSRKPDDLPAFCSEIIKALAK